MVRLLGLSVDAAAWLSIESGGGRFQGHPVKKTETVKEQSQPVDPIDKTQSTLVSLLDHPVESSFNFFYMSAVPLSLPTSLRPSAKPCNLGLGWSISLRRSL